MSIFGVVTAVVLLGFIFIFKWIPNKDSREVSKADLRALLKQAHDLLILCGNQDDQIARDFQAGLLLNTFLSHYQGPEKCKRLIAGVKTEMDLYFGRQIDATVRFTWRESIHRAISML